jgi:DNA polymerase V
MIEAGILPGALLVVDRAAEVHEGDVVIARLDDELCVKRFSTANGAVWLLPANRDYEPIEITEGVDFEIWGRVMYAIQQY